MKILYADESGNTGTDLDNKNQPIFVLGALSIKDKKWHETNDYFNQKKIEIYNNFKDIEIHANEIFSPPRKSIFHIKNWQNNLTILDQIVDLIMELDIKFKFVAIHKKNFKADIERQVGTFIKIDPYIYGFAMLYDFALKELSKKQEKGIIFLDEIISIPEALSKLYPDISVNNHSIIEKALFLKSRDTNFIQIADIYAFYVCQYLNITNGYKKYSDFKEKHCINNFNKLITKTDNQLQIYF